MEDNILAGKVLAYIKDHGNATVSEIANALDEDEQDIVSILDEYSISNNQPSYVGPGGGGGWLSN